MKCIKTLVGVFSAAVLLVSAAYAAPSTNAVVAEPTGALADWAVSLSGKGATSTGDNSDSAIGAEIQLGHSGNLVLPLEAGVRQSISYSDVSGASWLLGTKVYSDWTLIKVGNLQFDVGGNIGANYGDTKLTWLVAPEVVGRLYLKKDVDVFARLEYPFDLNAGKALDTLVYSLGLRVRF